MKVELLQQRQNLGIVIVVDQLEHGNGWIRLVALGRTWYLVGDEEGGGGRDPFASMYAGIDPHDRLLVQGGVLVANLDDLHHPALGRLADRVEGAQLGIVSGQLI